jgi:hypothetical protein
MLPMIMALVSRVTIHLYDVCKIHSRLTNSPIYIIKSGIMIRINLFVMMVCLE